MGSLLYPNMIKIDMFIGMEGNLLIMKQLYGCLAVWVLFIS